ncbi:E3 SUMO-protein ligase ZBED1-like [Cotesia typhae]|uniref:E3 SUMO-protein ligase ZBED1-like n=1 Tax=Cotesia typhae TaxID=2053667 RepID=UPI003D6985B2
MAPSKKSDDVWRFFDKTEENKNSAKCRLCQKFIKSCGNTTNLIGHLKNIHKAAYQEFSNECSKKNDIQSNTVKKNTHLSLDPNISDPLPSTSSAGIMTIELTSNAEKKCDSLKDDVCVSIPPAPKRQKSIVTSFQDIYAFSERGDKTLRINNALIYMICKDNQPFTIVENEGFASLIKVLAPHYKLPSKTTLTRCVDDKYAALSTVFKAKLANIVHVTLTTDMWSETMIYESNDRHTSEHISDMLLKTCAEWNIDNDKVSAVVTDNAANMVKAVDLAFGKKHIPCFAHTLNLVAQNAIQQCAGLRNLITKLKEIVTWFKQSNVNNELRKATEKETKLIQEVPTRWNSTYYMIERFLELRTVVNNIIILHKNAPPMLTASELSVLSSVLQILRPIEAATKEVSGDKYCTSSKVIPLIHCLLLKVKPLKVEESLAQELQTLVLKEIDKRMGAIERNDLKVARGYKSHNLNDQFKKVFDNGVLDTALSEMLSAVKESPRSKSSIFAAMSKYYDPKV